MIPASFIASTGASVIEALPHLSGMLMVMITLALLWGVCVITAAIVRLLLPAAKPAASPPAGAAAPKPQAATDRDDPRIAPEIVAVIAAAVATVSGNRPVRIVSIKPMSTSWERAGRQSVLTSHRIR